MDKVAAQSLATHWKKCIEQGLEAKKEFQADADECMRFFDGPYNFMYGVKEGNPQRGDFAFVNHSGDLPRPSIMMTVNKVAELVQLFGPSLYHQNPWRTCNPTELPDLPMEFFGNPNDPMTAMMAQPMLQSMSQWQLQGKARGILMQALLNYFPKATDHEIHMRRGVDETLIKGMSVIWTEVYRPIGAKHKLIGSFYDTVDNYVKDPDATCPEDVKWIARKFTKPVWEFEAKFGLKPGSVRGNRTSNSIAAAGASAPGNEDNRKHKTGKTNDLIVYWQIWSKMGLGGLLREIAPEVRACDRYGQFVQIVVCEDIEYPVNMPEECWADEKEMYRRAQWETPHWADDAWPCTEICFHEKPNSLWPISHLKPGMGELKLINWAFSFLASRLYKTSKDYIAVLKGVSEEIKRAVTSGKDLELIEIEIAHGKSIKDLVSFLQHPEINKDFWEIIAHLMDLFEKRTGLSELMYGASEHQYRSAAEADVKSSQISVRPDDMAKKIETAAGKIAAREALAARWHMNGNDVGTIFGPIIGGLWDKLVASTDVSMIIHQLQFSVEAGTARKRNKNKDAQDAKDAMTTLYPTFFQAFTMTGDPSQVNALITMWGRANDIDVTEMLFKAPLPPPMPTAGGPNPNGQSGGQPPPAGP